MQGKGRSAVQGRGSGGRNRRGMTVRTSASGSPEQQPRTAAQNSSAASPGTHHVGHLGSPVPACEWGAHWRCVSVASLISNRLRRAEAPHQQRGDRQAAAREMRVAACTAPSSPRQQHVWRLDVKVDDAARVQEHQPLGNVDRDLQRTRVVVVVWVVGGWCGWGVGGWVVDGGGGWWVVGASAKQHRRSVPPSLSLQSGPALPCARAYLAPPAVPVDLARHDVAGQVAPLAVLGDQHGAVLAQAGALQQSDEHKGVKVTAKVKAAAMHTGGAVQH